MSESEINVDIVVVGAGMVGASAALGFAQQGFDVAVVEAFEMETTFNAREVDHRVSALTRASENLLSSLGVWSAMQAMRVKAYSDMRVWDANGDGMIHFDAAELAEPSLGHIVENKVTQSALWSALREHDCVTFYCPERVESISRQSSKSVVYLSSGCCLSAKLVVAADGKKSVIREQLGIDTQGWLYDQHAVVATITTTLGHQDTAWQRFMSNGPLALLPLGHNKDKSCSIVWSTSPEKAEQLCDMDEQLFCRLLTESSESVLGEVVAVDSRATFGLELKHAKTYIKEGFVLIGDAAHAVHPLAGQGVNLGFLDVMTLLDVVAEAKKQGRELGGLKVLRKYERTRKGSNLTMLAAMDGFKRLFSNHNKPVAMMRNTGLSLADRLGPVKNFLVRYAMGL